MTEQQKIKAQTYRNQGYGYGRIAKELNISVSTVSSYFLRLKEKESRSKLCLCCGKPLKQTKGHRQKKFCGERCRRKWWKGHPESDNRKAFYTLRCRCCGSDFLSYGNKNRKYCSWECYLKAKRGERYE